jgi:hypothetical protein
MMVPKGRLQICRKVCQVSESYHISAIYAEQHRRRAKDDPPVQRRLHKEKVTDISSATSGFALP